MNNYIEYLNKNYSEKTFARKLGYIKYNFGRYLKFPNKEKIKALEIGPGMGEVVKYLSDKSNFLIDVADNDRSILEHINGKFKIQNSFCAGTLNEIDDKLSTYKVIIATQVLEHVPVTEQLNFVKLLYKHLDHEGVIIITVPNMANPFTLYERYGDVTHESGFTDNSLRQLCLNGEIPLSKIEIKGYHIPPYSILNLVRIFFQKLLHAFILLLSIINGGGYSTRLTPNITLVIKK